MLKEMAVADAYAVAWEFLKPHEEHPANDWAGYKRRNPRSKEGSYTDDTQRALSNVGVIRAGLHHNVFGYIAGLKRAFHRDPREGYSRNMKRLLLEHKNRPHEEWLDALKPRNTNGAIMGVAPLGFLKLSEVKTSAWKQARATHDEEAASYAVATALAAHALIYGKSSPADLHRFVLDEFSAFAQICPEIKDGSGPVEMTAASTYRAVMSVLRVKHSLRDLVDYAIERGGDTDSVAAVSVALASCCPAFRNDFPSWAWKELEVDNHKAKRYLVEADDFLDEMRRENA